MRDANAVYRAWLENPCLDEKTREELLSIEGNTEEIEDRFYQELSFGTAGLRGVLGAGTNRMNIYTVARAAFGFAQVIKAGGEEACRRGIAISYDSRNNSDVFSRLTARIFVHEGVAVRLSDELRPVPFLSFAIRHFDCAGGVMVTASHNPRIYNGFKVYGADGGQLPPGPAEEVARQMETMDDAMAYLAKLPAAEELMESPLWRWMGKDLDDAYDEMVLALAHNKEAVARHRNLSIVYTPLNGTGNKPVRRVLKKLGLENISVVPEQEHPDGNFPTCPYPNPEAREALELGIQLAEEKQADLLIATDPDADRTGVAVRSASGEFVVLSGNEIGILLMDYVLSTHKKMGIMPEKGFCVSSVVSSRLTNRICQAYDVSLYRVLTGFKFIAEAIARHDENGDEHFLFGYEESFGYLAGLDVRDKDAVVSSMLIAEMACDSADRGETLHDRLLGIFETYGYASEKTVSLVREGISGRRRIDGAMAKIREEKTEFFKGLPVKRILDFDTLEALDVATGETLPLDYTQSNVLVYELEDLDWFACRPSGTEPKLKIYMGCYRKTRAEADEALAALVEETAVRIEELLDA